MIALTGAVSAGGSTYSGQVTGPVEFKVGQVATAGPLDIQAEGFPVTGAQGDQATQMLIAYMNAYLGAAPGLKVATATLTADGVHVTGTAPDTISW